MMMISWYICSVKITVSLAVVYVSTLKLFIFCVDGTLTGMLTYNMLDDLSYNDAHSYIVHGKRNFTLQSTIIFTKQRSISIFGCL